MTDHVPATLPTQEVDRFEAAALRHREDATSFEIVDHDSFLEADQRLKEAREFASIIAEFIEPYRAKAKEQYDFVLERKRLLLGPLSKAESTWKRKLAAFREAERKHQREEQKRLLEEARAKAEARRQERIREAKEAGDDETAERIAERPAAVDPADVSGPPAPPTPDGTQFRERWSGELVDGGIKKLCAAVAAGDLPEDMVKINKAAANRLARALKARLNTMDCGLRAVKHTDVAVRS